ncbi:MAG: metalloregulator ArsR/SmtB family transcription factor [Candidatus Firestonebacteria bacterium]
MYKFINIFKSLSDRTRLRILHLLIRANSELCICEIVDSLKLPQSNISKHIRELKIAGLVREKKQGRFVLYSLIFPKDKFTSNFIKTVSLIPEDYFSDDNKNLTKRVALRIDGKVVIGMRKRCKI